MCLPKVVPRKRAHAVSAESQKQPYAGDDEADGEDHDLSTRENESNRAVLEKGQLGLDGELGQAEVAHDHIVRELARDESGFVGRDVGGDDLAVVVGRLEGDNGDDKGLELSPKVKC